MTTSMEFVAQSQWVELPQASRTTLRELFKIPKSGNVRVTTFSGRDKMVSDGVEPQDLMGALNVRTCLAYLGKEWDERKQYDINDIFPLVLEKAGLYSTQSKSEERREVAQASTQTKVDPTAGKDPDPIPPKEKAAKPVKPGAKKIKINQKNK